MNTTYLSHRRALACKFGSAFLVVWRRNRGNLQAKVFFFPSKRYCLRWSSAMVAPLYVENVLDRFTKVKKIKNGWEAQCPSHDDSKPSLNIAIGKQGSILLCCHAGCPVEKIVAAVGLGMKDLFPAQTDEIVATYDYLDADGELLFQVVRHSSKRFHQRRPSGNGGWIDNLEGVQRVLYHLPEILAAPADQPAFLTEGEKDADNLRKLGLLATTNPGGAGKWRDEYAEALEGRPVFVIPDNDDAGQAHAKDILASLPSARIIHLPGLKKKGDVSDWISAGGTREDLLRIIRETPSTNGHAKVSIFDGITKLVPWPDPINEKAYHGIAGELARRIAPETEADPLAILIQFMVAFGNVIGRSAYFQVERTRHYLNLFAVLVGRTSRGRKGTAMGWVEDLLRQSGDSDWIDKRVGHGLSSGEGLISEVRDPVEKNETDKETGQTKTVIIDAGESDKRLLIVEEEFAGVLVVANRDGNTLSSILRQSWDSGRLRTMTKQSRMKATGAHISIIGHVTKVELVKRMREVEVANGFANRFLWVCVKRSQLLPFGGGEPDLSDLIPTLQEIIIRAKFTGKMGRTDEGRKYWASIYPSLNEEKGGSLGMLTDRGSAQVLRLSCIYALLDGSIMVDLCHIEAALALWRYCEASCQFIFGESTGNTMADEIYEALAAAGSNGLSRREIFVDVFQKHKSSKQISDALGVLRDGNMAAVEVQQPETGRPKEIWKCAY